MSITRKQQEDLYWYALQDFFKVDDIATDWLEENSEHLSWKIEDQEEATDEIEEVIDLVRNWKKVI